MQAIMDQRDSIGIGCLLQSFQFGELLISQFQLILKSEMLDC